MTPRVALEEQLELLGVDYVDICKSDLLLSRSCYCTDAALQGMPTDTDTAVLVHAPYVCLRCFVCIASA